MPRHRFIWKSFVSFIVLFSFAVLALTGAVLYVAPAGRVANWSNWTLGALQKQQWQAVHTIVAVMFLAAGVFHLVLNWPVLRAYLRMRLTTGGRRRRELAAATALTAVLMALAIGDVTPARQIMALGETAKAAWESGGNEPPVPHAELLSVARLAELRKLPPEKLLDNLRQAGYTATADTTLAQVASSNRVTPSIIYWRMTTGLEVTHTPVAGGGYGKKTVEQIAAQLQIPVDLAIERLREGGITSTPESNMREIAVAHGKLPTDLVNLMAGR